STSTATRRPRSPSRTRTRSSWSRTSWPKSSWPRAGGDGRRAGRGGVLRSVLAPNPSPLTLEGTRTYLDGRERLAVIDPHPSDPALLVAVPGLTGDGVLVAVLITHAHPDHDEGADEVAARFDAPVRSVHRGTLADGDRIETDAGALVAVATPGHTPDHIAFHWPAEGVVFCG